MPAQAFSRVRLFICSLIYRSCWRLVFKIHSVSYARHFCNAAERPSKNDRPENGHILPLLRVWNIVGKKQHLFRESVVLAVTKA